MSSALTQQTPIYDTPRKKRFAKKLMAGRPNAKKKPQHWLAK